MPAEWYADLNDQAVASMKVALRHLDADELAEIERRAHLPEGEDLILDVDECGGPPAVLATAKHLRDPRLLVWSLDVLTVAKDALRAGYRVRLTVVHPASGQRYVSRIERAR